MCSLALLEMDLSPGESHEIRHRFPSWNLRRIMSRSGTIRVRESCYRSFFQNRCAKRGYRPDSLNVVSAAEIPIPGQLKVAICPGIDRQGPIFGWLK